jgi:hypothetical protein
MVARPAAQARGGDFAKESALARPTAQIAPHQTVNAGVDDSG